MNKDFFMNKRMRQIVGEEIDNVMKNNSEGKYASTLQDEELTEVLLICMQKIRVFPLILLLTVEEHTSIMVTHYACI